MLLRRRSLAVLLGQSPGQALQELVHGEVDLCGEVCGEVHGRNQHDVVGQDLRLCQKHRLVEVSCRTHLFRLGV